MYLYIFLLFYVFYGHRKWISVMFYCIVLYDVNQKCIAAGATLLLRESENVRLSPTSLLKICIWIEFVQVYIC